MAGIYIHVPFCVTRCAYCDFYSNTDKTLLERFIENLCKEIIHERDFIKNRQIKTIYFGGGTPSLLSKTHFERIFSTIEMYYDITDCEEITLECNPDDLTESYLSELSTLSFNRLSIGIQSFNDDELKLMNRRHSAAQAIDAVKRCQSAGFENISVDLIYGLPSQDVESFKSSINQAISLNIQHISAYHLTYEKGTVFYAQLKNKTLIPIDENSSNDYFILLRKALSAVGFEAYEISNFSKKGFRSKHNSSYWKGIPYFGFGPSAHSYNGEIRRWNVASINEYLLKIEADECHYELEHLSTNDVYNELIMTSLRTIEGCDLNQLKFSFGDKKHTYLLSQSKSYIARNLLQINDNRLSLTESGIMLSDGIIADLMSVD